MNISTLNDEALLSLVVDLRIKRALRIKEALAQTKKAGKKAVNVKVAEMISDSEVI